MPVRQRQAAPKSFMRRQRWKCGNCANPSDSPIRLGRRIWRKYRMCAAISWRRPNIVPPHCLCQASSHLRRASNKPIPIRIHGPCGPCCHISIHGCTRVLHPHPVQDPRLPPERLSNRTWFIFLAYRLINMGA